MSIQGPGFFINARNMTAIIQAADPGGMQKKRSFADQAARERSAGIEMWYREGGLSFVDWAKKYYRTSSGIPLHWDDPYAIELWSIVGHPYFERVFIQKPGQIGWTELLICLISFFLAAVRIPAGLGFDKAMKVRDIVSPRLQPAFSHNSEIQRLQMAYQENMGRQDIDTADRKASVGGVTVTYFWGSASVSARKSSVGDERQVSSSSSSWPADAVCIDEVEGCPLDFVNIAEERMEASRLPSKPLRAGSTPGGEGGVIDTLLKSSGYHFQWYVTCPECSQEQALDPRGNLLRSVLIEDEEGVKEERFFDEFGTILDWFSHDNSTTETRIKTAYVGCKFCAGEITKEDMEPPKAHYKCSRTGTKAVDLLAQTLGDGKLETAKSRVVSQGISVDVPRLAVKVFHAPDRIYKLLNTRNPIDGLQQGLGIVASVSGGRMSLKKLQACVGLELPEEMRGREPDFSTLGVDQGHACNWAAHLDWYLPDSKDWEIQWQQAHVVVRWWGKLLGFDGIEDYASQHGIDMIGIDLEPDMQKAGSFSRRHPPQGRPITKVAREKRIKGQVFLFDQVYLKGAEFRRTATESQGETIYKYSLDRTFGLDAVQKRFSRRRAHLPASAHYVPGDQDNLFVHMLSSSRNQGQWVQSPGLPDHLLHALNFAEVVALAHYYEPRRRGMAFISMEK